MNDKEIKELVALLSAPKKVVILPHRSPDGDAMGSTLGLYHLLLKLNHEATVISPNDFPSFLEWMPGSENVLVYENDRETTRKLIAESDLIFTLDFNALHRTGEMETLLSKVTVPFIMIDHHQSPDDYATYTFSDTSYGSTCEMLYEFIVQIGKKSLIDKTIATCLYTGILTDSGGFKFPKTTGNTHRIVAEFIELGVENTLIPTLLFDNSSYNRLQLLGRALQNLKVISDKKTAYIALSQNELNEFNYEKGDTEGIVNYGLSIKGIHFAAIFIEHTDENIIKISFRSQGDFDVNQFARTHFNGGGHMNAAGGKSNESLEKTIEKFKQLVSEISI
jgi:bifunctional oligoribonuclease and PAP phosphatase NrnA